MSAVLNYQTEYELQQKAYAVLHQQLGNLGFIRFIQQYERGQGNYTTERHQVLGNPTVDELFDEIMAAKNA